MSHPAFNVPNSKRYGRLWWAMTLTVKIRHEVFYTWADADNGKDCATV